MSSLQDPNRQPQRGRGGREGGGPPGKKEPNNPNGARGLPKCPECRRKKQKCVYVDPDGPCDSCSRTGRECEKKDFTATRYTGNPDARGSPYAPVASRQSIRRAAPLPNQFSSPPQRNLPNPVFLSNLPEVSWANFPPGQRLSRIVLAIERDNPEFVDDVRSILRLTEEHFQRQLMPHQSQQQQQLVQQPIGSRGPAPALLPSDPRQHPNTLFQENQPTFPDSEATSRRSSSQEAPWHARHHFEQFSGTFTNSQPQPFLSAPAAGPSLQISLYRDMHDSSSQSNLSQNLRVETPGSSTGPSDVGSGHRGQFHGPVRRGSQFQTSRLRDSHPPMASVIQTPTPMEPIPSTRTTSTGYSPNSNQAVHPNAPTPAEPDPEIGAIDPAPPSPFEDQDMRRIRSPFYTDDNVIWREQWSGLGALPPSRLSLPQTEEVEAATQTDDEDPSATGVDGDDAETTSNSNSESDRGGRNDTAQLDPMERYWGLDKSC